MPATVLRNLVAIASSLKPRPLVRTGRGERWQDSGGHRLWPSEQRISLAGLGFGAVGWRTGGLPRPYALWTTPRDVSDDDSRRLRACPDKLG